MKTKPAGYIILAHDIMGPISKEEIIATLPEAHRDLDRPIIHISPEKIQHGEAMQYHWKTLLIEQERIFEKEVRPLLEEYPDYEVLYFGLAPIPLAVQLGHKMTSFRKARVFLKDHTTKKWEWADHKAGTPIVSGEPKEKYKKAVTGEVIIRFGTRAKIESDDTTMMVKEAIREIEIYPPEIKSDLFGSFEEMEKYAAAFRDALDAVASNLPGVRDVHLFAAIPVGLAFLIGQEISPTFHPLVHIYEYNREDGEPYHQVYTVNEELNAALLEVSTREREMFQNHREGFKAELEKFVESDLSTNIAGRKTHWFKALAPDYKKGAVLFDHDYWNHLQRLDPDRLVTSFLKLENVDEENQETHHHFHDRFLKVLMENVSRKDLNSVVQLFALRKTVWELSHRIRPEVVGKLSRYPRVMEEMDYQADVFAMLHWFFCKKFPDEPTTHFAGIIDIHLQTLWAFDRAQGKTERMEVQRVNRYLTWYYLLCRMESGACKTLDDLMELLSRKPIIELRLNALRSGSRDKVEFDLQHYRKEDLGLGLFHNGRMELHSIDIQTTPISDILEGLREQEPEKVKNVLHALITKISD